MLQTGALIRDLSVRELITMMASLYPDATRGRRSARRRPACRSVADRRTQKLSGGQTQRTRFAHWRWCRDPDLLVLDEPTVALDVEARHGFWAMMRDFAATRQDRRLRDPLPRGSRRLRRSRRADVAGRVVADGPPTEIKARVGRRIIRATLADADARRPQRSARRGGGGPSRRQRRAAVHRRRRGACGPARRLSPASTTSRSEAPALEDAFLELTAERRPHARPGGSHDDHGRLHPLRAAACRCATPGSSSSRSCSRSLLFFLIAGPNRDEQLDGISFAVYYMTGMISLGNDGAR